MREGPYLGNEGVELPKWLDSSSAPRPEIKAWHLKTKTWWSFSHSSLESPQLMDWFNKYKADQDMFIQQLWANQPATLN